MRTVSLVMVVVSLTFAAACGRGHDSGGVPRNGLRLGDVDVVADGDVTPEEVGELQAGDAGKLFAEPFGPGLDSSGELAGDALQIAEIVEFRYRLEVFREAQGQYPQTPADVLSEQPEWLISYSSMGNDYELTVRFSTQETATLGAPE